MTSQEKLDRATKASILLQDETLNEALADMRRGGLEHLVLVNPTDADEIRKWQAYVAAVDALKGQLNIYLTAAPQQQRMGVA